MNGVTKVTWFNFIKKNNRTMYQMNLLYLPENQAMFFLICGE